MKNLFVVPIIGLILLSLASCEEVPQPIPVTGVSISAQTLYLVEGESSDLSITITPMDADNQRVTWSSSNPSVASVINGKVSGIKAGNSTITVTTEDGNFTTSCEVTVAEPALSTKEILYRVDCNKQDIEVDIMSNVSLVSSIDDDSKSWISIVQTKAYAKHTLTIHIESNNTFTTRSAIVNISYDEIERTIVISQSGQPIRFADKNLFSDMIQGYDKNKDNRITSDEVEYITSLSLDTRKIHSIDGLQYLPNLTALYLNSRNGGEIQEIDLTGFQSLESLTCENNNLNKIIIPERSKLNSIWCQNNNLTELDLQNCPDLLCLVCSNNRLNTLNLSNNTHLTILQCDNCEIETILLPSSYCDLGTLSCQNNKLSSLDLSYCHRMQYLYCENNQIDDLGIMSNPYLTLLSCSQNNLSKIDLSSLPYLDHLYCDSNPIATLNCSQLFMLSSLSCNNCKIEELDISSCQNISSVSCKNNREDGVDLKTIYIPKNINVRLNIPSHTEIVEIDSMNEDDNDIITIQDPYFKKLILSAKCDAHSSPSPMIDRNGDGEISVLEAKYVKSLELITSNSIKSLSGVEYFSNMESFSLSNDDPYYEYDEKDLPYSADFSKNDKLSSIYIVKHNIDSLFLPNSSALTMVRIYYCPLKYIDPSNNTFLETLIIEDAKLESLDVKHNTNLKQLSVRNNNISSINLDYNNQLNYLCTTNNPLQRLDVSNLSSLNTLESHNNDYSSLDVHRNTNLRFLGCRSDVLETLYIFKNYYTSISTFDYNPNTTIIVR